MGEPGIDYGRMLEVLDLEVELLADATYRAPGDRVVTACPSFTLSETARHVGAIYRMLFTWLSDGVRPMEWRRTPKKGQPVVDYLREGYASLRSRFAVHDPADPCVTWYPPQQHYGFWVRRMLHETTVHRCDAQITAGIDRDPVAQEIATDGVDEVLSVWFEHRLAELGIRANKTAGVLVETGSRRWLARMSRQNIEVHEVEGQGERLGEDNGKVRYVVDAVVRGSPLEVYLWLWGRVPFGRGFVEVTGSAGEGTEHEDAVAQMWALLRLATR